MTEIKQGTNEWLAAKKQYIGGSEIYGLAHHYCKNELEAIGIDLYKEKPFTSAQELFLKVKFGFDLARKDTAAMKSLLAFGNAMEGYVFKRLQGELNTGHDNKQIKLEQKHDFVVNKDMHDYACCSPDGYIDLVDDRSLQVRGLPDYSITKEMGRGALELKTARHDALQGLLDENVGAPAKYMLQNQYQIWNQRQKLNQFIYVLNNFKKKLGFDNSAISRDIDETIMCTKFQLNQMQL